MKLKSALALAAFCLSFNLCAAPATDASIEELLNLTKAQRWMPPTPSWSR